MYILEAFIKWLNKNKRGVIANPSGILKEGVYLNREGEEVKESEDEALTCKHNFMPIDSTGEVLACTLCGFMIKKRKGIKN